ncbi:MAG: DNA (cytosine-5-)-methyltransferase [Candidatus Amulumruptor caecigallinarius]|nr:MAG: DNA (cytosine-5-)-methyltransferase [Candidatus Amulumruptor caecigallinarius]
MTISADNFANLMGVSKATLQAWETNHVYVPKIAEDGTKYFNLEDLAHIPEIKSMIDTRWDEEMQVIPARDFYSIELFAGGGGLALGMSRAGFKHVLLNEFDHSACETLRHNRPQWNVVEGDVCNVDFSKWKGKVDFISGGFPCQAFSYAGKGGGFNDTRGTMFFQLARAVKEIQPKVFMGENVRGLAVHDNGRTLEVIKNVIVELGYTLIDPRVLKALRYKVPQKRERLILIAVRNDYADKVKFEWPSPYKRIMTLRDAFFAGELYPTDVPDAPYQKYPEKKRRVLAMVPEGGDWRDLPIEVQKEYMGASFYLGGGKTGMARRLSLDEPSLTLTCAPAQKQTERCHPIETRPLTVREYARIQTFPDDWEFAGNLSAQYKQIGNAVPVNLAWAIGRSIMRLMNQIESIDKHCSTNLQADYNDIRHLMSDYTMQLTLFEPETMYISTSSNTGHTLIGPCRKGTIDWINTKLYYNYPITEDDIIQHKELFDVKTLIVRHKNKLVNIFHVRDIRVVKKNDLKLLDYPIRSSRHKADTKYILYSLQKYEGTNIDLNTDNYSAIFGKGVISDE